MESSIYLSFQIKFMLGQLTELVLEMQNLKAHRYMRQMKSVSSKILLSIRNKKTVE